MRSQDVEKMMVGSIKELLQDSKYFYHSNVGHDYCHLTDQGKEAVLDLVNIFGGRFIKAMADEDVERSKRLVLEELKK